MVGEKYKFTATFTGSKRDTNLTIPKYLITDIRFEDGSQFRDHTWIKVSKVLTKLNVKSHQKNKPKIEFTAIVEKYVSSEGTKLGLRHVRNVKRI